nr:transposase [Leptolyngbya sp. FACHB-36]
MDCSFIAKSGKATCGRDWYWNGCANRVEQGLEVSLIGVVDVEAQTGYALSAQQTFAQKDLPDLTRMDQYLYHLDTMRCELPPSVKYLAVDGAYAKENFITGAVQLELHVISKLRCDANLRWLYMGEQKPRGRRRKYDGKVELSHQERLTFVETLRPGVDLYTATVFHVSLKRTIRLAYPLNRSNPTKPRFVVLFSTDVEQDPLEIYRLYSLRFQVEFLFRDAKQFTGLADCQARDCVKLEFHFNASFTALNLAKIEAHQQHHAGTPLTFSMASMKRRALNEHLLERFISNLDLSPSVIKAHPNYEKLRNYGMIAA